MTPITDNESAACAKYEIERALLSGTNWQLADGNTLAVMLEAGHYEFSVEWSKLIFAWWNEEQSQSWQVTAYEIDEAELCLKATRGMGRESVTFTLRDPARWRTRPRLDELTATQRRSDYAAMLVGLIASRISNVQVLSVSTRGTRATQLPAPYLRLKLKVSGESILAIGVNGGEAQTEIDGIVTAGIVWLAGFNERRRGKQRAQRLWLCVPRDRAQTVIERLTFIDVSHLGARVECFEVDEEGAELTAVRPVTQDELLDAHPRELHWPREAVKAGRWRERIVSLAPDVIEVCERLNHQAESYAIHGLEFARTSGQVRDRVSFGVMSSPLKNEAQRSWTGNSLMESHASTTLTETNFVELEQLVREIVAHRCAQANDRRHPFYRLRSEAWLESILRREIRALDLTLNEQCVYSQIPAWRADERSVIDLLTINHQGRLVVIEIKAAEDAHLPLQGLDYWLRVEQARVRGEFERRGLFPGFVLANESPLLYLVAPRLRFHRSFSIVARCLSSQIEAYRLGLNADWRAGVRVHAHERVN